MIEQPTIRKSTFKVISINEIVQNRIINELKNPTLF